MAFVVVLFRGEELTRRELTGPLVIGRAPECDVSVRDILLSRRHCRIEPAPEGGGWVIEDLGSKNGTRIGGEAVTRAKLRDAMGIRLGKTHVKFYAGAFRPGSSGLHRANGNATANANRKRPSDPLEALSGTVEAFDYKAGRPARDVSRLPAPRPKPTDPAAYSDEDVYSLLTELASSSWDSIYATASGPAAVAVEGQANGRRVAKAGSGGAAPGTDLPPRSRHVVADPSLQVIETEPSLTERAAPGVGPSRAAHEAAHGPVAAAPPPPQRPATPVRAGWRNPMTTVARGIYNVLTGRFFRRAS